MRISVVIIALAACVASCFLTTSFDRYGTGAPSGKLYGLNGDVEGLDAGAVVSLLLNGASARQVGNGPFAFPALLLDGAGYDVTIASQPPGSVCSIGGGAGRISGADAVGISVRCLSSEAALVHLSASAGPLSPAFDPATFGYGVVGKTSAVLPSATTTVTAAAKRPGSVITVDGVPSVSLSGDALAVGAPDEASSAKGINGNPSDTSTSSAGAVYVFTRSAATWAQLAYVKASNTRLGARFGSSVAVWGTTLSVGSPLESSGAKGINGNQSDTSLYQAGAAYVF